MIPGIRFKSAAAWLLAGGAMLSTSLVGNASVEASIQSVSAPGGTKAAPFYVIDADASNGTAGYDRDTFSTDVTVDFSLGGGSTSGSAFFLATAQLIDDQGNAVALAGSAASSFQQVNLDASNPTSTRTFSVVIDPDVDLGAGRTWFLRVLVKRWQSVGTVWAWVAVDGPDDSASFVVVHFTGPNASDWPRNVRGYTMGDGSWEQIYAVASDPDKNEFKVGVPYRLMRYDAGESWVFSSIGIALDVDLFDETGAEVPLENDGVSSTSLSMYPYLLGLFGPSGPSASTGDFTASFRPTANLDSVNHRYHATVNLQHVEEFGIPTSTYLDDGTEDVPEAEVLHFNGTLMWDGLATTMSSISNNPSVGGHGSGYVTSQVQVDGQSGGISTRPDLQFGTNQLLSVRLYPDGHAEVYSGEEIVTQAPSGGRITAEYGHVNVIYTQTRLSRNGPYATAADVILPQGLGYTPDPSASYNRFERLLHYASTLPLDSQFRHSQNLGFTFPAGAAVFDEARPLVYSVSGMTFGTSGHLQFTSTGSLTYCHGNAFEKLRNDNAGGYHETGAMAERMTNDGYLHYAKIASGQTIQFTAAADGSARLDSVQLGVEPGTFLAHFPVDTRIAWYDPGTLEFGNGQILASSKLKNVEKIEVPFDGSCPNDACAGGGSSEVAVVFTSGDGDLFFSRDGSLHAGGEVDPISLQWGLRSDGSGGVIYSHRTGSFSSGVFDMAGQFIYAAENPAMEPGSLWKDVGGDFGAASILLAGGHLSVPNRLVYPVSESYVAGDGYYAGANFVAKNSMDGASRIGGAKTDFAYNLMDDVSKYYVRRGGLSGRHVPKDGSYSDSMKVYGYHFAVTLFQLTFLSNNNVDSWFNGAVDVPYPSDFTQAFKGMTLTCTGDLDHAEIDPEDPGPKKLAYWNGQFSPLAILFSEIAGSGTPCYPERALVIGLSTEVAHVPGALSGKLAFMNDGNIGTPADGVEGADGRLGMPASIPLDGPTGESWSMVPCTKLYFNNPDFDPDSGSGSGGTGFVTFAGTMNAPWFEDLEIQLLTSAKPSDLASVYLTGGWTSGGQTFFSDTNFDSFNKAYPQGAVDLATYRNLPTGADYTHGSDAYFDYRVKARQSLFGLIPLEYPQTWNITGRYFKSAYPVTDDLVVIKDIFHQVDYMSPEHLDVSFGAKYEGLPRINLAGAAFEAADEQLGAAKAITDAAGDQVTGALNEGVAEIDALVADALEDLIDELLQELGVDVFDPLYQEMMTTYAETRANGESFNDWLGTLDTTFNQYFDGTVGNYSASLRGRLDRLASAGNDAMSMVNRAKSAVDKGILAIDAITREINGSPGLLKEVGGQRQIVQTLVKELIKQLAGDKIASALSGVIDQAGSEFNQKLNELLSDMDPTFDQLVDVLEQLRGYLVEVQTALDGAGEIVQSFQDIVTQATTELDTIVSDVRTQANQFIANLAVSAQMVVTDALDGYGNLFDDFSQDTFRTMLAGEIRDMLLQSGVYQQFQYVLRQWVSDLDMAMHNAIDSVFAEVQNLVKEVIDEALGPIDDAINEALGDIDKYLGAGSILGSAIFNGDSLKRLRLDGEFQFKIPDDMELHAYLEINQYESGDDFPASGCLEPGEKALEVKLGATDVGVDWLSPDMRADMEVKFSMKTAPSLQPRGVGGAFEMSGGSMNFEAFKITEFAAGVGIGLDESYIAASARMEFTSYELAGGLFFGKTCTIDPLEMIDKDVAELLGAAPFTGAYVYGEVWLPISEIVLGVPASCMFDISAGVGAGAFYFLEGPTWGGQMLLGVSGEALCVVSLEGKVKMIGVMAGDSLRFSGRGSLTGKAGVCPFCIKFSKSAKLGYQDGDWSVDL